MMVLSRFVHTFDIDHDHVALYHSLRMKPVYLTKTNHKDFLDLLQNSRIENLSDFPDSLVQIAAELSDCKILTNDSDTDDMVIKYFRSKLPEPAISGCYFILSEQCNLACKYCFLGNNNMEKRKHFSLKNMSMKTAKKALWFFIRQLEKNDMAVNPFIIFYGGEPLINFEVLDFIAGQINELRLTKSCLKNINVSVVTNGLLLDEKKLKRLKALNVNTSISIDGCTEEANALRVDRAGNPTFLNVLKILDMAKDNDIDIGLSVTINEETIKNKSGLLELISKYNIKGFGFNIIMPEGTFKIGNDYNEKATQFIIDMFVELRKTGVYEDRIMRKIKTFQNSYSVSHPHFSDCGATSGGQIVVASDGSIGICHGCLWDKKYFVSSVDDNSFNAKTNPVYIEWSHLSPLNKEECQDCVALGICGGGCPIDAMNAREGNTIHSLDERFCIHSKKTLDFIIRDLYHIISNQTIET
jgi:uncharacterized protein